MQNDMETLVRRAMQQPTGLDTSKIPGYTAAQVGHLVCRLRSRGELFTAKLGARTVRYFAEKKDADAYLLRHGPHASETRKKTPGRNASAFHQDMPAIETEHTKRDIRKTPVCLIHHRYWVDPASVPVFRYGGQS